ncbi:MAG: hypothetical protein UFA98_01735 [Ruminococcus sp.]|nr:hypothetical protein [Ruminococcus sp.]
MIRVNNLHIPIDYDDNTIKHKVCKELRIDKSAVKSVSLFRRSIDARKKDSIYFLCSVDVVLNTNENAVLKKSKNASPVKPYEYRLEKWTGGASPVVVGMGPAGLFAALILAQSGARPVVLERGRDVDSRTADVQKFWKDGRLNVKSNVQFGEGGAGTFSDGKLNTGTKDIRQRKVLEEFVKHGAPDEILYNAKPHIGTDKLKITVKNIREEIISLGGTVIFEACMTGFITKDGKITAVEYEKNGKKNMIETDSVIMALGHSARDTFEMLNAKKIPLEAKPFSVGARIEHLCEAIDKSQYGKFAGNKNLGAASYKMNVQTQNGRGAYTFCMCPGGRVVNASSEDNMLCTNGMSEFSRNEVNSNAALLVGVTPKDYQSVDPLAGMYYQRRLEAAAFKLGGESFCAPVQCVEDFLQNRKTTGLGEVKPSILPGYELSDLNSILPEYISDSMKEAITAMGKRLKGFDFPDAVLTGLETRSSSPVRILRDAETLQSVGVKGLYPCGEGAGYAGGIISAAVDGIKCAEKIIQL